MINIPVLRWGKPYTSLEADNVIHFVTGETLAKVSQANPGLLAKDIRQAQRARDVLCEFSCRDLISMMKKAADLYKDATLPLGDGVQSPGDFARQQSASTGLPEHMCKANMAKNIRSFEHGLHSELPERIPACLTKCEGVRSTTMKTVTVEEVASNFPALLRIVQRGEELNVVR